MKALKITGAIIAGLAILFLGAGLLLPRVNYTSTVSVNASPEKCWKVFHDTSRMGLWTEGFRSLKLIRGDSIETGAIYELVILQEKRMIMTEEMTEVIPPVKMIFELKNEVLQSNCRYDFIPKGNTTQITSTFAVRGNNLFWRSLFVFFQSYFQTENDKQMEGLKKVIEATAGQ